VINVLEPNKDPVDTDCVVSAANNLEVSEFRIFQDAYTAWYGREAAESNMNPYFIRYITEDKVPFWVRNYARSKVPDAQLIPQSAKDAGFAKTVLYLASFIVEYAVLAYYLAIF